MEHKCNCNHNGKDKKVFHIPVNSLSKDEALKVMRGLMTKYKEKIDIEDYFIPIKNDNINDDNKK